MKDKDDGSYTVELLPLIVLPVGIFFAMFFFELNLQQETYEEYEVCYPDITIGDGYEGYLLPQPVIPDTMSSIELRVGSLRQQTEEIEEMLKEHKGKTNE
tara:strand:- start:6461 stop:6760 length:300 start_codon:yes stop_codon:yes gene_type:complete